MKRKNKEAARSRPRTGRILIPAAAAVAVIAVAVILLGGRHGSPARPEPSPMPARTEELTITRLQGKTELRFPGGDSGTVTYVRPNWVPEPADYTLPVMELEEGERGGWGDRIYCRGREERKPYSILVYPLTDSGETVFWFDGHGRVTGEDRLYDWDRREIAVDYPVREGQPAPAYESAGYVLLYSAENRYFICIGGTADMDTLKKISENLTVRVTGEKLPPASAETGGCLDFRIPDDMDISLPSPTPGPVGA